MEYKSEINDFNDLYDLCWSGALDRIKEIDEADKGDEFFEYIKEMFYDRIPTDTEINDFIWFEVDDWIEENCKENDDEEEEDDV